MSYFDILAARAGARGDAPTPPVLIEKSVTQNGTYTALEDEADGYSAVTVNVPNTYTAQDEGKVVSSGVLVAQSTHKSITANGTGIDTTNYSSVDVAVPNTYTQADEGKVVSNGALVAQTSDTVMQNGTVDTTLISSLLVNVSGGGGNTPYKLGGTNAEDLYIIECDGYIYIFGTSIYTSGSGIRYFNYDIPSEFDISTIGTLDAAMYASGSYNVLTRATGGVTLNERTITINIGTSKSFSKDSSIFTMVKINKST